MEVLTTTLPQFFFSSLQNSCLLSLLSCNTQQKEKRISTSSIRLRQLSLRRSQITTISLREVFRIGISLIIGGMDPLNTVGVPDDAQTTQVLNHWVNNVQRTRCPISHRPAWLRSSPSDPTLLSATTPCSGSYLLFLQGITRPTPLFIWQKLKAIQAINQKLQCPKSAVSDYTIISVAIMTLLECLSGTPAACAIHRNGLELLVRNRGGIRFLGLDGITQRIVSWADTCCAIVLRSKPRYRPNLTLNTKDAIQSTQDICYELNMRKSLSQLTQSSDLGISIAHIWSRIRQFSEFLTSIPPTDSLRLDDILYSDTLDSLEREILDILNSSTLADSPSVAFLIGFLNSALIYIYQELREIPHYSVICVALAGRVHSGLQMLDLSVILDVCPDLLLWTLLVGKSAAPISGPNRGWFGVILLDLTRWLNIRVPERLVGVDYFDIVSYVSHSAVESREGTVLEEAGF